jgi:hypothetical protein
MKKLLYVCLAVSLILVACGESVTFQEPQPTDTDNLSKFPMRVQGQYISLRDSSTLIISDKLITRSVNFSKIHLSELDSTFQLSGDTIIELETNEKQLIKRDGDSLIIRSFYTLFQMNYDNVVREFKGYYFLNTRYDYDKTSWGIKKIQLSKGQLIISSISNKQDMDNLTEIIKTPQDTVSPRKFSATKKQFTEFIKNEGFSDNEIFVRQKK